MCGIAGFLGEGSRNELEKMIAAIKHRGPDDTGILHENNIGLAHARLSIIDTSSSGHQPMTLQDGSVSIVLNGEIYNYRDLREELVRDGCTFRGTSDTEVILWLYKRKGIECFKDLVGMFAIGLYDKEKQNLLLVRDRMGEKPLYWTKQGSTILFASELRALVESRRIQPRLNLDAARHYFSHDYVPTPMSIFEDVFKLEPATILICTPEVTEKKVYWKPSCDVTSYSVENIYTRLDELMQKAVSREVLAADVPLGVFLSGGLDSSTVAYYAQRSSSRPIDTFSIGFKEFSFDESRYAREVAAHIGSNHHEETLSPNAALELVQEIPEVFNEPIADASVLPAMLLSRFARKSGTVALGGDGGDELFARYPTFQAEFLSRVFRYSPAVLQSVLRSLSDALPASQKDFSFSYNLCKLLSSHAGDPVERHLEWLGSFPPNTLNTLAGPALGNAKKESLFGFAHQYAGEISGQDQGNRLLYTYARTYLMDEVLVKVDRASMRY